MKIEWELPLKTVSEANCTEHWTKSSKRHRQQQFFVRQLFSHEKEKISTPCIVRLIRLSPRDLDDDNLRSAFKFVRDEISECMFPDRQRTYTDKQGRVKRIRGRLDDSSLIKWEYGQRKSKITGVRIEIEPDPTPLCSDHEYI